MLLFTDSIWIISGIPGAGKPSVSKSLARRLPRAAHVETDLVREMIVTGYRAPGMPPIEESDAQLELGAHNAALLADSFMAAGFTPIVDDVVLRLQLARYCEMLSRWPVRLVVLAPTVEAVIERDRERKEKHVGERYLYLHEEMLEQMQELGLWLDTSRTNVEETVDAIIRRADDALLSALPH